jgi:cyclase
MKSIILFLSLVLLFGCGRTVSRSFQSDHFDLLQLSEGVYACVHKFGGEAICNAGVIDNGEATIIFDTFLSPRVAGELKELVDVLDLSPVRYVVNSHAHNDHIRGNQVFDEEIQLISTKRTAELIGEWEPHGIQEEKEYAPALFMYWDSLYMAYSGDTTSREFTSIQMWRPYYKVLSESYREVTTRIPDVFVEGEMELNGPDRKVRLISRGPGNTESDLILFLPDDGIIFSGDLVFNEMHPYLGDGDPEGWLGYLDFMDQLEYSTIVPGHGQVCGQEGIQWMKRYIADLQQKARQLVGEDFPVDSIAALPVPAQFGTWWFERFYPMNLRFMVARMSGPSTDG